MGGAWKSLAATVLVVGAVVGSNVMAYRTGSRVAEVRCDLASIDESIVGMQVTIAERHAEVAKWTAEVERGRP